MLNGFCQNQVWRVFFGKMRKETSEHANRFELIGKLESLLSCAVAQPKKTGQLSANEAYWFKLLTLCSSDFGTVDHRVRTTMFNWTVCRDLHNIRTKHCKMFIILPVYIASCEIETLHNQLNVVEKTTIYRGMGSWAVGVKFNQKLMLPWSLPLTHHQRFQFCIKISSPAWVHAWHHHGLCRRQVPLKPSQGPPRKSSGNVYRWVL